MPSKTWSANPPMPRITPACWILPSARDELEARDADFWARGPADDLAQPRRVGQLDVVVEEDEHLTARTSRSHVVDPRVVEGSLVPPLNLQIDTRGVRRVPRVVRLGLTAVVDDADVERRVVGRCETRQHLRKHRPVMAGRNHDRDMRPTLELPTQSHGVFAEFGYCRNAAVLERFLHDPHAVGVQTLPPLPQVRENTRHAHNTFGIEIGTQQADPSGSRRRSRCVSCRQTSRAAA